MLASINPRVAVPGCRRAVQRRDRPPAAGQRGDRQDAREPVTGAGGD